MARDRYPLAKGERFLAPVGGAPAPGALHQIELDRAMQDRRDCEDAASYARALSGFARQLKSPAQRADEHGYGQVHRH